MWESGTRTEAQQDDSKCQGFALRPRHMQLFEGCGRVFLVSNCASGVTAASVKDAEMKRMMEEAGVSFDEDSIGILQSSRILISTLTPGVVSDLCTLLD